MSDAKELVRAARERGALEGEIAALEDVLNEIRYAEDLLALRRFVAKQLNLSEDAIKALDEADDLAVQAAQDAEIKAERDAALDEHEPVDVDRPANPTEGHKHAADGWQGPTHL